MADRVDENLLGSLVERVKNIPYDGVFRICGHKNSPFAGLRNLGELRYRKHHRDRVGRISARQPAAQRLT